MGTFAGTANVDYRLLFADQGKLTYVFCFPFAENKGKFAASVFRFRKQTEVAIFRKFRFPYIYIYIYAAVSNEKR
jgi:hypothetical protein